MNSFFSLVQQRRSIRKFTDQNIPQNIKEQLIQIALMSPASKSRNPWEFIVVENRQTIDSLADCKAHGSAFMKSAPLAIVVIADTLKSDAWIEDTSITSIYLQLAAEDLGLGSCWVQVRMRQHVSGIDSGEYIRTVLQIPSHYEVESIIAIGYKAEEKQPFDVNKANLSKVHYETF